VATVCLWGGSRVGCGSGRCCWQVLLWPLRPLSLTHGSHVLAMANEIAALLLAECNPFEYTP
jgi:hypothetical protein